MIFLSWLKSMDNLKALLIVGIGGALGSMLRFKVSGLFLHSYPNIKFPIGTFMVNIIGCFIIGMIGGWIVKQGGLSNEFRLFFITGVLGGFTTFSAFALDTFMLLRGHHLYTALAYVSLSIILGMIALSFAFSFIPKTSI